MKDLEIFKMILSHFNISEVEVILWSLILLVVVILFKYYSKEIDKSNQAKYEDKKSKLEIYSDIVLYINKYKKEDMKRKELYYKIHKLLPICSIALKKMILAIDLNNEHNFNELTDKIITEFNTLKYAVAKNDNSFLNSAMDVYSYYLRRSGFTKIIISIFYTFISMIAIFMTGMLIYRSTTLDAKNDILFSFTIAVFIVYFFLIVSYVDILISKRFKFNIINIVSLITIGLFPIILKISYNIITVTIFGGFLIFYILVIYSRTIKENNVFKS